MKEVNRETLAEKIADLELLKESGAISLHGEYNLAAYKMLLATMDSKPVGEFYEDGPLNWYQISPGDSVPDNRRIPLYRSTHVHAVMRDHEIREFVNQLRDVAVKYHNTGQLRERIARTVRTYQK